MLSREFETFFKYYNKLQELVLKEGIYCNERPSHRYDFVILESLFDDKYDSMLDDIIEDMYGNHTDNVTEVPIFGALVMSKDYIDRKKLPLADEFFKQKKRRGLELNSNEYINAELGDFPYKISNCSYLDEIATDIMLASDKELNLHLNAFKKIVLESVFSIPMTVIERNETTYNDLKHTAPVTILTSNDVSNAA